MNKIQNSNKGIKNTDQEILNKKIERIKNVKQKKKISGSNEKLNKEKILLKELISEQNFLVKDKNKKNDVEGKNKIKFEAKNNLNLDKDKLISNIKEVSFEKDKKELNKNEKEKLLINLKSNDDKNTKEIYSLQLDEKRNLKNKILNPSLKKILKSIKSQKIQIFLNNKKDHQKMIFTYKKNTKRKINSFKILKQTLFIMILEYIFYLLIQILSYFLIKKYPENKIQNLFISGIIFLYVFIYFLINFTLFKNFLRIAKILKLFEIVIFSGFLIMIIIKKGFAGICLSYNFLFNLLIIFLCVF